MLKLAREQETLGIVNDQIRRPTWAHAGRTTVKGWSEPAEHIKEKRGLNRLAGGGLCSRYKWAKEILKIQKSDNFVILIRESFEENYPNLLRLQNVHNAQHELSKD